MVIIKYIKFLILVKFIDKYITIFIIVFSMDIIRINYHINMFFIKFILVYHIINCY